MNDEVIQVPRFISVGICTSSLECNVEAFIKEVSKLSNVTTRFIELPYNNIDSFHLPMQDLDGVILCHSINNRRFSITDVTDALYDRFLPRTAKIFGRDNVLVIAHDFNWPMGSKHEDHIQVKDTTMTSFRRLQPTTFQCCHQALICGKLDKQVDIDEEDWNMLVAFLHQAQSHPQPGFLLAVLGASGAYAVVQICRTIRHVHLPVQDNTSGSVVDGSYKSQGFVGKILWLLWFPFKCILNTIGRMWSFTRPGGVGYTLGASFKDDVINKTLEMPQSRGIFLMVFSIYALPFKFAFHSCLFGVALVRKGAWTCFQSVVGKCVWMALAVFFMLPFIGKAYYTREQDAHAPGNEVVSRQRAYWNAPWWKLPFQFWRHYFHVGYTSVRDVLVPRGS